MHGSLDETSAFAKTHTLLELLLEYNYPFFPPLPKIDDCYAYETFHKGSRPPTYVLLMFEAFLPKLRIYVFFFCDQCHQNLVPDAEWLKDKDYKVLTLEEYLIQKAEVDLRT